jgi:hypothetical protein
MDKLGTVYVSPTTGDVFVLEDYLPNRLNYLVRGTEEGTVPYYKRIHNPSHGDRYAWFSTGYELGDAEKVWEPK